MKDVIPNDAKLRAVCLPATHDAGTYSLSDKLAPKPLPAWLGDPINTVNRIKKAIRDAGVPGPIADRLLDLGFLKWVIEGIKLASVAQPDNIATQLKNGIRCLDLRVALDDDDGDYKIHHGLFGPSLPDVLDQCRMFLETHSGEILYITFGHWCRTNSSNNLDKATFYDPFYRLVTDRLGDFAYTRTADNAHSLFDQTYGQITGNGTRARCILVMDDDNQDNGLSDQFWPVEYNPPSYHASGGAQLYGSYTKTDDLSYMRSDKIASTGDETKDAEQTGQLAKLKAAGDQDRPFALYLTLTPSDTRAGAIVVLHVLDRMFSGLDDILSDLSHSIDDFLKDLGLDDLWKLLTEPLADKITALKDQLEGKIRSTIWSEFSEATGAYRSLEELSGKISDWLRFVWGAEERVPSGMWPAEFRFPQRINLVYVDFYSKTPVVGMAVAQTIMANKIPYTQAQTWRRDEQGGDFWYRPVYYLVNHWREKGEAPDWRAGMGVSFTQQTIELYPASQRDDQWMPVEFRAAPAGCLFLVNRWRDAQDERRVGQGVGFEHRTLELFATPDDWMPVELIQVNADPTRCYLVNQWHAGDDPRAGMVVTFSGGQRDDVAEHHPVLQLYPFEQPDQWMPVELQENER